MKQILIGFILGAILNGAYVQYRIAGTIWGRPQCESFITNLK